MCCSSAVKGLQRCGERHAELTERSTFTRPRVYTTVALTSTHTQHTDAGCELSQCFFFFLKNNTCTQSHTHSYMHTLEYLRACSCRLQSPVTHCRHPRQTSSCLTAHRQNIFPLNIFHLHAQYLGGMKPKALRVDRVMRANVPVNSFACMLKQLTMHQQSRRRCRQRLLLY